MKLKSRFKKALFAFFKEEILHSVGHNQPSLIVEHVVCKDMRMIQIHSVISLDDQAHQRHGMPASAIYEHSLHVARKKLFEESMKFVHIDERSILDPNICATREIKVSLFVGVRA